MKISTFKARDMREALNMVKEALGEDAVILSTRSVRDKVKGGSALGDTFIEVTACPNTSMGGGGVDPGSRPSGRFSAVVDDPVDMPAMKTRLPGGYGQSVRGGEGGGRQGMDVHSIKEGLRSLEKQGPQLPISSGSDEVAGLDHESKRNYSWLLMHGVEEPIARKIIVSSSESGHSMENALKESLQFRDPLSGKARVVALVGPTGVGKTTTLAKLAADLMLNRQRSVGMVTLDTFRVGAVAQLETYAKLLQVRLVVARSLSEVKAGLHSLNRCDFVLVDTVGSSPYNRRQVNSTAGLLPVMGDDREVILCMSANVRESEQHAIHRRFSVLNPTGLIFTKLDETVTYGGILNVAVKSGLPLTMYTDGQRVPENLGWMSPKTLATWFTREQNVND
ncbi:MAG: GTP-binding signal recognition particle SRP54, G-domain [Magnetococcales bacterium]|nr:GTP-binding signal recognition particle SRP54, G-domain [Magnetococcales bacterium]HIJ84682.1 flagellar biosynthesis protein FlhF [Magnetococcales bacterium]